MVNATVFVQDPAAPTHRAALPTDTLVDGNGTPIGGSGGVPTTRVIATTAPLTGGGDLSADRTLAVSTFGAAASGIVPLSGGGTTNFLRADGTWAAPGGGSDPWTHVILASETAGTTVTIVAGSYLSYRTIH